MDLKMRGDDLEDFIAEFECLMTWSRNAKGSIYLFKNDGLPRGFLYAILENASALPQTLDQWQEAARRRRVIDVSLPSFNMERDPDALDIAAIHTSPSFKEERDCLYAEGCCCHCERQGHISRMCPEKN